MPYLSPETERLHGHLPRLSRAHYKGLSYIHWTLTIKDRRNGWLSERFHAAFREMLAHAQARYLFACPAYCLMPDHLHLVWLGLAADTDQVVAMTFVRKQLKPFLSPAEWQEQAHDHVLRSEERERGAFQAVAWYILSNPVRAGLAPEPSQYPYSGCFVAGYPALSPFQKGYWDLYWKIDNSLREKYTVRVSEDG